jgi:hypothetical protein
MLNKFYMFLKNQQQSSPRSMVSNAQLQIHDTLMIQLFIKIENGILCYL